MLPLLKKEKLSNNQCELHFWGLCSFASLGFVSPFCWKFWRNTDAAWDGLDAGMTLLVPVRCFRVAAVDQLCIAHTVVCALSFSSLTTPKIQSVKGIAGIITLLCFPGAYSAYVLVLFLLSWDSALSCTLCMVFPKWGCLSTESLLTYHQLVVSKCSECFGMYSPSKEWFVAWHFSNALMDIYFLIGSLAGCSSPAGTTCLKPAVGALLLCVFFPWAVFCEEFCRISSISRVHVPTVGCWGERTVPTACLVICFPEPCVGWDKSEITAPVNSLQVLHKCYNKFWEALDFWMVNNQFYTSSSFMDPQVR